MENNVVIYQSNDGLVKIEAIVDSANETIWATSVLKQYMIKGYTVNQSAVSEQKYEDLKRALGLLRPFSSGFCRTTASSIALTAPKESLTVPSSH